MTDTPGGARPPCFSRDPWKAQAFERAEDGVCATSLGKPLRARYKVSISGLAWGARWWNWSR